MTAATATVEETSASNRPGILRKTLYILLVFIVAFILYKGLYNPRYPENNLWWYLGTGWLLLGWLVFVLFLLNPDRRRFGLFLFVNLVLAIVISNFIQGQLTGNARIVRAVQDSAILNFFLGGFAESLLWSIVVGAVGALLLTGLPLLTVALASATYILALHEVDGVSRWDALRYVLTLILGINLPFMVVENGQALVTREAGTINVIGGPGELIIKQGNVVVLERGGKISRVVNAGIVKLKRKEMIRNIFVLGPQSKSDEIRHVLTKDRIPLTISLAMKVQIEPAAEVEKRPESRIAPDGEALTKKLDDGLYQVYEGTIHKAALMSQSTSFAQRYVEKCEGETCRDVEETTWQKVAGSLPEGELRDHIMSHRFDELFELVDSAPGEKPEIRVDKRKIYEIEQAILAQIRPTKIKVLGVLVRGVDIGKIEFRPEAEQLLLNRWGAPWAQQIGLIEAETKAQGELQARMLKTQGELEAKMLEAQGELEATRLEAQGDLEIARLKARAILINAKAEAQKLAIEGCSKAEAQAAFFRCILESLQVDGRPSDPRLVRVVLGQLAHSFASVNDLETFMRVHGEMNRQGFMIHQQVGRNGSSEVGE
jgi:regulator of protease activity HflC (stomatin/prohibitin superfamily)